MFVRKSTCQARVAAVEARLERLKGLARAEIAAERGARRAVEARNEELVKQIAAMAQRPPHVIQPPDTAGIVQQCVEGMATILNGWRNNPESTGTNVQMPLDLASQGLDAMAGVSRAEVDNFFPPWEEVRGAPPRSAEFVNARIGDYKPYVPGEGNISAPKGGVE
jgi:hypothetical protein